MTRVCQVVQHLSAGGIETLVLELARLAPSVQDTRILSLEGRLEEAVAAWPRLEGQREGMEFLGKRPGWRMDALWGLRRRLRQLQPDAVHTHHVGPLIYGGLAARLAGVRRLVHTEHDAWHLRDPRRRRLQRAILTLVRPRLVADSAQVASAVKEYLPGWPVQVISNGIDTEHFTPGDRAEARAQLGLGSLMAEDAPLIGCAARLHPVKGHRFLIDALGLLPSRVHLVLAGGGEEERTLRAQAQAAGLENRVHFLGRVDVMTQFYRALDLFCLPSLAEGMPLSPLEAQSCGVPVVVSDVGGARESVCPASGRLVPPGNVDALAEVLGTRIEQTQEIDPRLFVLERGDARAMVRRYTALYS